MKKHVRALVENVLFHFGAELALVPSYPSEYEATYRAVRPFTMTSRRRVYALIDAVDHVVKRKIPGDFVECGVWKGGSSLAAAMAFSARKDRDRDFYLFDTFEGMTSPTERDGAAAIKGYDATLTKDKTSSWCHSPIDEVREVIARAGYPQERIHLVKGPVEDTLPGAAPSGISLLRLDTDWYESTRHELVTLYPRLAPGGILIFDDYGFWAGARKAVDEFLTEQKISAFLHRIDESGAMLIKPE